MVRQNGLQPKFGNLIPEFERCVRESQPQWFVMENVPDAPRPKIDGYETHEFYLNLRQCFDDNGEPAKTNRLRAWTFGVRGQRQVLLIETACFENREFEYAAIGGSQRPASNGHIVARNPGGKLKKSSRMPFNKSASAVVELCRKQGVPDNFLDHCPFTVEAKCKALGNGVPLPMGRAIARAIKELMETISWN